MRQEKPTLYWDNAATTWPKPVSVHRAIMDAMNKCGGNPGRAGHRMSMEAAEHIFACRQEIAEFFGLADPTGVVFTLNCTMALNMVIQGVVRQGGRVLISDLEHNAVWRTACALEPFGSRVDIARWSPNAEETVENFRRQIRPDTRLLVCTHASNVFGVTFPVRELAQLAHRYGVPLCVDAAQSAGVLPINMETDEIDYLCVAAHKGLYAPMGTGVLLCREMQKVPAFVRGGTGSQSENPRQPEELPDRLESGTPNVLGICGLLAGVRFVQNRGRDAIYRHELGLVRRLYNWLQECKGVTLYTERPQIGAAVPVLSVNVEGLSSEQTAVLLHGHGVAVRAGLHCAPLAHKRFGTLPSGTVRLAPSAFTREEEVEKLHKLFSQIAQKTLHT